MANKNMKICLTISLREKQIKTTMRHHYKPNKMAINNNNKYRK